MTNWEKFKFMIKDFFTTLPDQMKATWKALKFYMTDWRFAIPVCLILVLAIWLIIREVNYDKWYPTEETVTNTECVEEVNLMDSIQIANLNLLEILKDCPLNTEFYTSGFGLVKFQRCDGDFIIVNSYTDVEMKYNSKGHNQLVNDSTCTIFPSKMNHNWYDFDKTW